MTIFKEDDIYSQTRKALKKNHMKDAMGDLYSRINVLTGNLLFRHDFYKILEKIIF